MSNPDPGTATDFVTLPATWFNTVRTGVLNALDIAGGSRTMTAKLTLLGSEMFELGDKLLYTSATVDREQPLLLGYYDAARWAQNYGTAGPNLISTTTTAGAAYFNLLLPHGNVLDSVGVWFKAVAGHGGAPANLPSLAVYRVAQSTGTRTQIGSTTTDTYGSAGAYETRRTISCTGLAHTIDNDANTYHLGFSCEGGANAIAGAIIDSIRISCTVTKQSKWR